MPPLKLNEVEGRNIHKKARRKKRQKTEGKRVKLDGRSTVYMYGFGLCNYVYSAICDLRFDLLGERKGRHGWVGHVLLLETRKE